VELGFLFIKILKIKFPLKLANQTPKRVLDFKGEKKWGKTPK
jgi:hypothetical protein